MSVCIQVIRSSRKLRNETKPHVILTTMNGPLGSERVPCPEARLGGEKKIVFRSTVNQVELT